MSGKLLTADDVAELLGVPKSWVYEQSRLGRIPTVTLGRYRRYRREAIDEWVRESERTARGRFEAYARDQHKRPRDAPTSGGMATGGES
jgi:excisionase family DNA binding protein